MPTPTATTCVVILDASAVHSICRPANALAVTVHRHNHEDDHSAQMLDLIASSSAKDSILAEMSDA